jgi:hypothetical protein
LRGLPLDAIGAMFDGMAATKSRAIRIQARVSRSTGVMAAYSDDLPGLLVAGNTQEEIARKLPGAVRELLEAHGLRVVKLAVSDDETPADFGPPGFMVYTDVVEAA